MGRVLVILLAVCANAQQTGVLALLTPGVFHEGEVRAQDRQRWLGLEQTASGLAWRTFEIGVRAVEDPVVDDPGETTGVEITTSGDPMFLLQGADHLMGRGALVHLSIIFGMFLFAWLDQPWAFFAFFVGCKVLGDLSQFLPRPDQGTPERPPRWLAAIMRRLPSRNGETGATWARRSSSAYWWRIFSRTSAMMSNWDASRSETGTSLT